MSRQKRYLADCAVGRNNNLNIMRLTAALLVIINHSVPLAMGDKYGDFLNQYSGTRLSLGAIAVSFFFITGGYLIQKSGEHRPGFWNYWKARIIRIFPPLFVCVVLCTFVLGPLMTDLRMGVYLKTADTYKYLLNSVFWLHHELPGVFEQNIYNSTVNGSLWTLPVEFVCYIVCFIGIHIKLTTKKRLKYTIPLAVLITIAVLYITRGSVFMLIIVRTCVSFYIGMCYYVYREKVPMDIRLFWMSLALFVGTILLHMDVLAMLVFFPYVVLYLAFGTRYKVRWLDRFGEVSYGTYLWGFPVQQTVCALFGGEMKWYLNLLISAPLAVLLGWCTYKCVEQPIARLVKKKDGVKK